MKRIGFIGLAAALLAACEPDRSLTSPVGDLASSQAVSATDAGPGAAYALTNRTTGNAVAVFARAADGTLTAAGTVATGGLGTGSGLGSQGALALSDDGRWLFAVNAGSNDVSVFAVDQAGLTLVNRVPSGGTLPISLTVRGRLLYVLNAGGSGNIAGFALDGNGGATPIVGGTRPLGGAGPAQVAFSTDGRWLVVTEKATNSLDVYAVGTGGAVTGPVSHASAGGTPFGFAFGRLDRLFVSEAAGSASSYRLDAQGGLTTLSGAVDARQGAPCWLVVTPDNRFAYTGNTGGGTITGFAVGADGTLSLLDADGATATVGAGAIDLALSAGGRYLYQLRNSGSLTALRVEADGHLTTLGVVTALPAGSVGLVAR